MKLNLTSKIFFGAVGSWLVGRPTNIKVRGTPEEVKAVNDVMLASRAFHDELRRPGATVETVMQKLGLKRVAAREFEMKLGMPWPL